MQNKVKELNNVITQNPPDMKKLQLVLQGSVSVQVHECCLMYSEGGAGDFVFEGWRSVHRFREDLDDSMTKPSAKFVLSVYNQVIM